MTERKFKIPKGVISGIDDILEGNTASEEQLRDVLKSVDNE